MTTRSSYDIDNGIKGILKPRVYNSSCESPVLIDKRKKKDQAMERLAALLDQARNNTPLDISTSSMGSSPHPTVAELTLPPLSPRARPVRQKNTSSHKRNSFVDVHQAVSSPTESKKKRKSKSMRSNATFDHLAGGNSTSRRSSAMAIGRLPEEREQQQPQQEGELKQLRTRPQHVTNKTTSTKKTKSKSMGSIRSGRSSSESTSVVAAGAADAENNKSKVRRSSKKQSRRQQELKQQLCRSLHSLTGGEEQQRRARSLVGDSTSAGTLAVSSSAAPTGFPVSAPLSPAPRITLNRRSVTSPTKKSSATTKDFIASMNRSGASLAMDVPFNGSSISENGNISANHVIGRECTTSMFHSSSPCIFFMDNNNNMNDDENFFMASFDTKKKIGKSKKSDMDTPNPFLQQATTKLSADLPEYNDDDKSIGLQDLFSSQRNSCHSTKKNVVDEDEKTVDIQRGMERSLRRMNSDPFLTVEPVNDDDDDAFDAIDTAGCKEENSNDTDDDKSFVCPFPETLPVPPRKNNHLNRTTDEKKDIPKVDELSDFFELFIGGNHEMDIAPSPASDKTGFKFAFDQAEDAVLAISGESVASKRSLKKKNSFAKFDHEFPAAPTLTQVPTMSTSASNPSVGHQDILIDFAASSSHSKSNHPDNIVYDEDELNEEDDSSFVLDLSTHNVDKIMSRPPMVSPVPASPRKSYRKLLDDNGKQFTKSLSKRLLKISKPEYYSPLMAPPREAEDRGLSATSNSSRSSRSLYSSLLWKPPLPLQSPSLSSRRKTLAMTDSQHSSSTDETSSLTENNDDAEEQRCSKPLVKS